MYEYVEDKELISDMRELGRELLHGMCRELKDEYGISATIHLVGSGKRKLILRNGKGNIDLDYNLKIVKCDDFYDCEYIKESVQKALNKVLRKEGLNNCKDSTSVLTTNLIHFDDRPDIRFSYDVCIIMTDEDERGYERYYRLIHDKLTLDYNNRYYWNEGPRSHRIKEKEDFIHKNGGWNEVREKYKELKNKYLTRNDHDHPSFICYVETVNNVYNAMQQRRKHRK